MWIKKSEYNTLKDINKELEKETARLAELISAGNPDCHVGPWCESCSYAGHDIAKITRYDVLQAHEFFIAEAGEVTYCGAHLQNPCGTYRKETRGYKQKENMGNE